MNENKNNFIYLSINKMSQYNTKMTCHQTFGSYIKKGVSMIPW